MVDESPGPVIVHGLVIIPHGVDDDGDEKVYFVYVSFRIIMPIMVD